MRSPIWITVAEPGFVSQRYIAGYPLKQIKGKLIRFSSSEDIKEFIRKVGKLYDLLVAYPTYLPKGFKVSKAEFAQTVTRNNFSGSAEEIGSFSVEWTKGDQLIWMNFKPSEPEEPPQSSVYRKIKINANMTA